MAGGIVPSAVEPVTLSFDLYDVGIVTGNRIYAEIRGAASPDGLLAAGIYNAATIGLYDASKYSARTLDGGGWISLQAPRSIGWHNFRFEIFGDSANLYVDGVLDPNFTGRSAGGTHDWVQIGSGLSSATVGYFDNVGIAVAAIPEPETYAMLLAGLGLLGFMARRRKHQAA
jgi:hypothetical protein